MPWGLPDSSPLRPSGERCGRGRPKRPRSRRGTENRDQAQSASNGE